MDALTVIIAGVAGFAFGAVWYGVLGKRWQAEVGLTAEDVKPANSVAAFIIGIAANIIVAGMFRHVFVSSGVVGAVSGLVSGLGLGLFVAGSFLAINYAFAKRSRALALIDIGHAAGVSAVIGLVLATLG